MTVRTPEEILSHWYRLLPGFKADSLTFYQQLRAKLEALAMPDTRIGEVEFAQGGMLSARRKYLRITRGELVFDICGAPFGAAGFFVSSWLGRFGAGGCLTLLVMVPGLGAVIDRMFRPMTYYQTDTALMFQEAVHTALIELLDAMTGTQGIEPIPEHERKPTLKALRDA